MVHNVRALDARAGRRHARCASASSGATARPRGAAYRELVAQPERPARARGRRDRAPLSQACCAGSAATTSTSSPADDRAGTQPRAAAGRLRGHARLLRRASSSTLHAAADRTRCSASAISRRFYDGDGRDAAHRRARARGGRAGRPHDDRPGPRHPAVPADDRTLHARASRTRCCWSSSPATTRTSSCAGSPARRADGRSRLPGRAWSRSLDPGAAGAIWDVRKAGLNIMMSMKGDGKPVSFIEDCAVPLEHLADYTDRLTERLPQARHARHLVRPCLGRHPARAADPQHASRRRAPRRCARSPRRPPRWCASTRARTRASTATASCARNATRRCSARAWSRAFEEVKDAFDPRGLSIRARSCAPPHMDDRTLFRFQARLPPLPLDTGTRLVGMGRLRRRRGDVQQQRRLPQVRRRRHVPVLPRHAATRSI